MSPNKAGMDRTRELNWPLALASRCPNQAGTLRSAWTVEKLAKIADDLATIRQVHATLALAIEVDFVDDILDAYRNVCKLAANLANNLLVYNDRAVENACRNGADSPVSMRRYFEKMLAPILSPAGQDDARR